MRPWFTTEQLAPDTWVISEYRHWEETHCYLLIGTDRALLIDTGLGICNIYEEVRKLTDKPVTAIATGTTSAGTGTSPTSTPMRRSCPGFRERFPCP